MDTNSVTHETLAMLIEAHQAEVYRYIKYLGADHALAEDITQDTFLAAYRNTNPPPMDEAARRGAWLRRIARNRFLSHCRRQRSNPVRMDSEMLEAAEAHWVTRCESVGGLDAAKRALAECVQNLPERSRTLLRLRYEEKRSRLDMARTLDLDAEGVKTALRRIRQRLAECMQSRLQTGGQA